MNNKNNLRRGIFVFLKHLDLNEYISKTKALIKKKIKEKLSCLAGTKFELVFYC